MEFCKSVLESSLVQSICVCIYQAAVAMSINITINADTKFYKLYMSYNFRSEIHIMEVMNYEETLLFVSWTIILFCANGLCNFIYFFKFYFIYLILGRMGRGRRKRGRETSLYEGNNNQLPPFSCPQLGTWLTTQACILTRN